MNKTRLLFMSLFTFACIACNQNKKLTSTEEYVNAHYTIGNEIVIIADEAWSSTDKPYRNYNFSANGTFAYENGRRIYCGTYLQENNILKLEIQNDAANTTFARNLEIIEINSKQVKFRIQGNDEVYVMNRNFAE